MSITAKSVIFDFVDNWGYSGEMGIRSIDFWNGGLKIANVSLDGDFTAYATSSSSFNYYPKYAFDTTVSKAGGIVGTSWATTSDNSQRIICVFTAETAFDEIRINNFHISGSYTNLGVKNVVINVSTNEITDTTYNASISNSTQIFNGQFDQHVSSNIADEQVLTLDLPEAYSVIYDGNGNTSGSVPVDSTGYYESDTVTVLGNTGSLEKTGHSFLNWNTAADGSGTHYEPDDTFSVGADDVTLYAYWALAVYSPEIIVTPSFICDVIGDSYKTINMPEVVVTVGLASDIKYTPAYKLSSPEVVVMAGLEADIRYIPAYKLLSPEVIITTDFESNIFYTKAIHSPEIILNAAFSAGINFFSIVDSIQVYLFTLTGEADGLDDIEIAMSSFQSRRRSGAPTYVSVVVPDINWSESINNRLNGNMKIDQGYKKDGEIIQRKTIIETTIDRVDFYEGGVNQSLVITGYSTKSYTPKILSLTGSTYRAITGGKLRYRLAKPYINLNPGDTVSIGDDTFAAGVISYIVSPDFQQVEIEEA